MATQSIYTNVVIDNKEDIEAFVTALEKAEKLAETAPVIMVDAREGTKEDYKLLFRANHE